MDKWFVNGTREHRGGFGRALQHRQSEDTGDQQKEADRRQRHEHALYAIHSVHAAILTDRIERGAIACESLIYIKMLGPAGSNLAAWLEAQTGLQSQDMRRWA